MTQRVKDPTAVITAVTQVTVVTQVPSLAQELLHASGVAKKKRSEMECCLFVSENDSAQDGERVQNMPL